MTCRTFGCTPEEAWRCTFRETMAVIEGSRPVVRNDWDADRLAVMIQRAREQGHKA